MKDNNNDDFWTYQNVDDHVIKMCKIDGIFRMWHSSAQYLIDDYHMSADDAYAYINKLRHI